MSLDTPNGPLGPIDAIDKAILRLIQKDGRTPYRQIAREVGISEGTVRGRVNRLQESGALSIIAIVDPHQMGLQALAFNLVKTAPENHQNVIDELSGWSEITYISSCIGGADLYVQLVCRDNDHLWDVLHERMPAIEGIREIQTFLEIKMHKVSYGYPLD